MTKNKLETANEVMKDKNEDLKADLEKANAVLAFTELMLNTIRTEVTKIMDGR